VSYLDGMLMHLAVFCEAFGQLSSLADHKNTKRKAGHINKLLAYLWSSYMAFA